MTRSHAPYSRFGLLVMATALATSAAQGSGDCNCFPLVAVQTGANYRYAPGSSTAHGTFSSFQTCKQ